VPSLDHEKKILAFLKSDYRNTRKYEREKQLRGRQEGTMPRSRIRQNAGMTVENPHFGECGYDTRQARKPDLQCPLRELIRLELGIDDEVAEKILGDQFPVGVPEHRADLEPILAVDEQG
jgi:hypothetical protein